MVAGEGQVAKVDPVAQVVAGSVAAETKTAMDKVTPRES
jgi:hypothetical protein